MITLTFEKNGIWQLGVKTEKGVLDVAAFAEETKTEGIPLSPSEFIKQGDEGIRTLQRLTNQAITEGTSHFLSEDSILYGPCVTEPQKIICVGLNYRRHAEESNMALPEAPLLFSKFSNTLTGHKHEVKLPALSNQVDYEVELAIIIGKKAKDIEKDEALTHVYGYCTANDLSARDLQFKSSQWLLGKTCDGFSPVGPYLVSADEVGDPQNLRIRTWVNGEVRQDSNTSDMIFYCDEIVSYISKHMTLYPGDIILTGTPEGVILGYPENDRIWLKDGDEVTVEIEKLGRLTNIMRK
ncbi:fumarylacetoacetate hydrolase family protein [Aneurinibacillus aneurinilyticus]|uniref:fumarylacetoacetate hydrolase family protein n=1 Tax=Aneurinibacillus aneurinilyticus TaxID=1391 RepID=UPI0023F2E24A|nr:fumarylacetoacetate hydrolase family protein [Aneurinibacillus aneurinilyticus]MED0669960.1 fumarylacetoacetate hydrolase family protein [Aneurinibacillus aneurinilyticus]